MRKITTHKRERVKKALRDIKVKLKHAQSLAHIGYWERDLLTNLITLSEETYKIFKLELPSRVISKAELEEKIIHPDDRHIPDQAMTQALEGGHVFDAEFRIVRSDGDIRFIRAIDDIERDESGKPIRMFGAVQDITERVQAEETIRRSERSYRILFENNLAGVYTSTIDGWIIECNDSFAKILGYQKAKDLQGCNVHTLYFDPTSQSNFIETLKEKKHPGSCELCMKSAAGHPVWILAATALVDDKIIQGTVIDITERKKNEEKISQMQRLVSLGQISATIAHEIRNPLASMILNLRYLKKNLNFSSKYENVYNDIFAGVTRIEGIVNGILQFSKTPVLEIQRQNICSIVSDALSLISPELKQAGIDSKISFSSTSIYVDCDSRLITQVFTNLFTNAYQAMPKGGQLTVRIVEETDEVHVGITDTGKGISKDQITNIFEPFFTTKPDGTGLGLAIVSKILLYHNAEITVESEPGRGSTFEIIFHKKTDH